MNEPVKLKVEDSKIELSGYSREATLADLRTAVEATRRGDGLVTKYCAGCGRCCYYEELPLLGYDIGPLKQALGVDAEELFRSYVSLPERPSLDQRRHGIESLQRDHDLDLETATILYEYNQGDPVKFAHSEAGSCVLLQENLCSIYESRSYICALYVCNMGERLSALQEQIVRLGVWHSYHMLGWIPAEEMPHNPFPRHSSYEEVLLSEVDLSVASALEKLFFYF